MINSKASINIKGGLDDDYIRLNDQNEPILTLEHERWKINILGEGCFQVQKPSLLALAIMQIKDNHGQEDISKLCSVLGLDYQFVNLFMVLKTCCFSESQQWAEDVVSRLKKHTLSIER